MVKSSGKDVLDLAAAVQVDLRRRVHDIQREADLHRHAKHGHLRHVSERGEGQWQKEEGGCGDQ